MGTLLARLSVLCVVILLLIALLRRWKLPYKGTLLWRPIGAQLIKMALATAFAWLVGAWLTWKWENRLLLAILLTFPQQGYPELDGMANTRG